MFERFWDGNGIVQGVVFAVIEKVKVGMKSFTVFNPSRSVWEKGDGGGGGDGGYTGWDS